jgi:hypothetical protein
MNTNEHRQMRQEHSSRRNTLFRRVAGWVAAAVGLSIGFLLSATLIRPQFIPGHGPLHKVLNELFVFAIPVLCAMAFWRGANWILRPEDDRHI